MIALAALLSACSGGSPREPLDAAVERSRGGPVDRLNEARGEAAPFFTAGTLNPTWSPDGPPVVRVPRDLELRDQDGKRRGAELFAGRTTVIAFFFTSCAGFCPRVVDGLKRVAARVGSFPEAQFVAVSIDPERDRPAELRSYARRMGLAPRSRWHLLTGSEATVHGLAKETFASQVIRRASPGPARNFAHTERFYVVDGQGRLRGVLNGLRLDAPEEARGLVAKLRREGSDRHRGSRKESGAG